MFYCIIYLNEKTDEILVATEISAGMDEIQVAIMAG